MPFINHQNYDHKQAPKLGILLTNLGSPQAPSTKAVRRYLKEFLWDPRMVEIPRPLWWLILNGVILPFRPAKSAHGYQQVWLEQGSPLIVHTLALAHKVKQRLADSCIVEVAMRYGEPSIEQALDNFQQAQVDNIVVLPLFPQYSATTTGSTFDKLSHVLQQRRNVPGLRYIRHYADNPGYIAALATQIRTHWQQHGRGDKLLMSYHGLPKRNLELGDPYYCYCHKTSRLLATELGLGKDDWQLVFQSRFGKAEWLQPYCEDTLVELGKQGVNNIDIICPGFAVDCLETLEEIAIRYRESFIEAGGRELRYIPALNAADLHADVIANIVKDNLFSLEADRAEPVVEFGMS